MTVLEAMAASKPVIATRVGAIPKVISDGENVLLVNPKDVDSLRDALASLLSDSDRCSRMGNQAHAWVKQNFTSEAMALKYRQLYEGVLDPEVIALPPRPHDHADINVRRA